MPAAQKFVARKTAAKTPAAKTVAAKTPAGTNNGTARRRVVADGDRPTMTGPNSLHAPEPIVGKVATKQEEWDAEEQVEVFVKRAFKFTTDDHVLHDINEGTQTVPRSWFEHDYFKAHGVTETEQRKTAK